MHATLCNGSKLFFKQLTLLINKANYYALFCSIKVHGNCVIVSNEKQVGFIEKKESNAWAAMFKK